MKDNAACLAWGGGLSTSVKSAFAVFLMQSSRMEGVKYLPHVISSILWTGY